MALVHKVEISWDDLLSAFSSGQSDRVYYLDKFTGEIFFIPVSAGNDEVWDHMDSNNDRFLEIPPFDLTLERRLIETFAATVDDEALKGMIAHYLTGRKPYGKFDDILSFFPEEQSRLDEMRDLMVSSRVRDWMEAHELFTANSLPILMQA